MDARRNPGTGSGVGSDAARVGTGSARVGTGTGAAGVVDAASGTASAHGSPAAVWTALGLVYVIWGSTYLAIAITVETAPPLLSMGLRFIVAATVLALFLAIRRGPRSLRASPREISSSVFVGVMLLSIGLGGITLAERYVPTGVAALIVAIVPLWIVLLRTATGDRPRLTTWIGVALGLVGLAVLVLPHDSSAPVSSQQTLWSLIILFTAGCWAIGSFMQPRLL